MQTLTEKRVYDEQRGARTCLVASDTGLLAVRVTGTAVGEFSLVDRRRARDVAVGAAASDGDDPRLVVAVATEDDVLVGTMAGPTETIAEAGSTGDADETASSISLSDALEPTGFGPATSVDVGPGTVVAAAPDDEIRLLDVTGDQPGPDSSWTRIDAPPDPAADPTASDRGPSVAAIDAPLVATDRGVRRIRNRQLETIGLDDVRDVDSTGAALAGTASGLYSFGDGWQSLVDEPVDAVTAVRRPGAGEPSGTDADTSSGTDADEPSGIHADMSSGTHTDGAGRNDDDSPDHTDDTSTRAYVASGSTLSAVDLDASGVDPSSRPLAAADDPIVDLTPGPDGLVYAITDAGTLLAADRSDSRRHVLGVRNPAAITLVGPAYSP